MTFKNNIYINRINTSFSGIRNLSRPTSPSQHLWKIMPRRLMLVSIALFWIGAALSSSFAPAGLTQLQEKLESPESLQIRLQYPSSDVNDELSLISVEAGEAFEDESIESVLIPLTEEISKFSQILSSAFPSSPAKAFLPAHREFLKQRCVAMNEKYGESHVVTQFCNIRNWELAQFLDLLAGLHQNVNLNEEGPSNRDAFCSVIKTKSVAARSLVHSAFTSQRKFLDSKFPLLHVLSHRALKRFECENVGAVRQFREFEAAVESLDMDLKMYCQWSYLDFDLWQETRAVIYEFLYMTIF